MPKLRKDTATLELFPLSDTLPAPKPTLLICINKRMDTTRPSCGYRGSIELADAIEKGVAERELGLEIERIHCLGHCQKGPTMRLAPGGKFYLGKGVDDADAVLDDLAGRLNGKKSF